MIEAENELELRIISDPDWIKGANWGEPRSGHPEGKVIAHIEEVLGNIFDENVSNRGRLRLIALVHDTFKYKVDRSKSKTGENHHAMIARRFAEKFISDASTLLVIETHDEAYNAWRAFNEGHEDRGIERAQLLLDRLIEADAVDLYDSFYEADNNTGDKTQDPFVWWMELTGS